MAGGIAPPLVAASESRVEPRLSSSRSTACENALRTSLFEKGGRSARKPMKAVWSSGTICESVSGDSAGVVSEVCRTS